MTNDSSTADELVGKELADVLRGLEPSLIEDLSLMHDHELEDLQLDIELMPYGDRAVLMAYGCITKSGEDYYTPHPKIQDLAKAAHAIRSHLSPRVTGIRMSRYLG